LISALVNLPKSSPQVLGVSVPRLVQVAFSSSLLSALRISFCIAVTSSRGVPLGAHSPYQVATT
jgi:hypothetical protein